MKHEPNAVFCTCYDCSARRNRAAEADARRRGDITEAEKRKQWADTQERKAKEARR